MSFLAVAFSLLIAFSGKKDWALFRPIVWKKSYSMWALLLLLLFATNNYFQAKYAEDQYFSEAVKNGTALYLITIVVSSVSEEIIYRGFLQNSINQHFSQNLNTISKGNLLASFFFFVTHLGFFTVMDPMFAVTSLLNVLVFSLVAGHLYDRTGNLLVPVGLHILINVLHTVIQAVV